MNDHTLVQIHSSLRWMAYPSMHIILSDFHIHVPTITYNHVCQPIRLAIQRKNEEVTTLLAYIYQQNTGLSNASSARMSLK